MDNEKSFLSKPEIQFWVPIITTSIVVAISWVNISGRVDLLSQKMDILIENQQTTIITMQHKDSDLETKYLQMQKQWGELSQRVTRIER